MSAEDIRRLIVKKEFLQYKVDEENFRARPDEFAGSYLKLHSYQLTAQNFLSPNLHKKSLHLQHMAGSGKTLSAIAIAKTYLELYRHLFNSAVAKLSVKKISYRLLADIDRTTPSIIVLGFGGPKAAFIRDLMRYPEFGFITIAEKIELMKLAKQAAGGSELDIEAWKDFHNAIKRRLTNKSRGGFFKFYGYDEFVNRLFNVSQTQLIEMEKKVLFAHREYNLLADSAKANAAAPPTLDDLIKQAIARDEIRVNSEFLGSLENALLICDEVHNTYNMMSKNNRGVAIQYVVENVNVVLLTMSATPFNNSPTEVVELLNYHMAANSSDANPLRLYTKRELFVGHTLLPDALDKISEGFMGKLSFIQDVDLRYFPEKIFVGESIILPADVGAHKAGSEIPYLKFTPCEMSPIHQETLNRHFANRAAESTEDIGEEDIALADVSFKAIPVAGYTIFDMVFPSPTDDATGLYMSGDIKAALMSAPAGWQEKNAYVLKSTVRSDALLIKGAFLRRENVGKYNTKAAKLLDLVFNIIASSGGDPLKSQKIMVYHERVAKSGILFYQELLLANGFLAEFGEPTDNTICCVCGGTLKGHVSGGHDFMAARFVIAHSMIDRRVMEDSLVKYNSPDNYLGHSYMIILGSRIVRESYEFKDVRHQIILSMPTSMSIMQQIHGRIVRKDSHANLPPEQRTASIHTFLTVVNRSHAHVDPISPEIYRYIDKIDQYKTIQQIERRINSEAFDGGIHRKIIMPDNMRAVYFPGGTTTPKDIFGNLYFEPKFTIPEGTKPDTSTFNAKGGWRNEIETMMFFIKKLFLLQPVWSYDTLWAAIRNPPFASEANPRMFDENNFIIALAAISSANVSPIPLNINKTISIDTAYQNNPAVIVNRLLDPNDRFIVKGGIRMKVEHIGDLYALSPIMDSAPNPLNIVHKEYIEHVRDVETLVMRSARELANKPVLDIETYLRPVNPRTGMMINVESFIREARIGLDFGLLLSKFLEGPTFERFLFDVSMEFQQMLVEKIIVSDIAAVIGGEVEGVIDTKPLSAVVSTLGMVGMLVTAGEIKRYKDVSRLIVGDLAALSDTQPIGYLAKKSVRVYDLAGTWIDVNKLSLNKQIVYKENDVIVGYIEPHDDIVNFKLRAPVQQIREKISEGQSKRSHLAEVSVVGRDTRSIEKGIVCTTKSKVELVAVLSMLGADMSDMERHKLKIHKLCSAIRSIVLSRELKNRKAATREKWLYFWWDDMPTL